MRGAVQAAGGEGQAGRVRGEHAGLQHEDGRGRRRPHRPQDRHRGRAPRRARDRDREEDGLHPQQRPPPLALDHRGPQVPWRQALLPQVRRIFYKKDSILESEKHSLATIFVSLGSCQNMNCKISRSQLFSYFRICRKTYPPLL